MYDADTPWQKLLVIQAFIEPFQNWFLSLNNRSASHRKAEFKLFLPCAELIRIKFIDKYDFWGPIFGYHSSDYTKIQSSCIFEPKLI